MFFANKEHGLIRTKVLNDFHIIELFTWSRLTFDFNRSILDSRMQIRLGNYLVSIARIENQIEKPRPLPRSLPLKGSYRFISPAKEREKQLEERERLPHPVEKIGVA